MEKALYMNGVYDVVLDEILKAQGSNIGKIFYLQPHAQKAIKNLKNNPPNISSPLPVYISTTDNLNNICYVADIVNWEDKRELTSSRLDILNQHMKEYQPNEKMIYPEVKGKRVVNLISILNLKKLTNQLSIINLIKQNGEPLKQRTRPGNWSYVYALPLLSIEDSIVKETLEEQFEEAVSDSLSTSDSVRLNRLNNAPEFPDKVQTISYGFKRNPDVVAEVLKRADGKCELCNQEAPFIKASNGYPYLEVHHWITLSEGGKDTVDNAGALCPNCHKQAHFGEHREYIKDNKSLPE